MAQPNVAGHGSSPQELHISIPADLLLELLAQRSIKPCQIRCLNPHSAGQLRQMCMKCCARELYRCPLTAGDVHQPIALHRNGYPTEIDN